RKNAVLAKRKSKPKFILIFFALLISLRSEAVPFESQKFAMASVSPHSIEAAKKVIGHGGNIVDATVAAALSMSVTTPYFAALGGGGFALIHYKGNTYALDFREVAPSVAHPKYYFDKASKASWDGGAAVGVPGVVAGLWEMHKKLGSKKWATLFE